jgi:hypothetical protein
MSGVKTGVLGFNAPASGGTSSLDDVNLLGGGNEPGPIGLDGPIRLDVSRVIAKVVKDWDPPNPTKTPEIVIRGNTLETAARQLNALPEWGQAGGRLRADEILRGNSTDLTVHLRGNLVYRLPRWANYDQASKAAKAEWDRMFPYLKAHEDRHLAIAIEEGDQLARDLIGEDISAIARMVTDANSRMKTRQDELDTDTDHGAKAGVTYGDVILDTSIK